MSDDEQPTVTDDEVDRAIITMALLMFNRLLLKSRYPKALKLALRERVFKLLDRYSDFEIDLKHSTVKTSHEPNRHSESEGR